MRAAGGQAGGQRTASPTMIWVALTAVYIIWGTTYLAIRVSNETLPPLIAAGVRFGVAGAVLYAISIRRGDTEGDRPGPEQWRAAAIVGIGLVAGGNGLVVLSERTIPSGVASLIIALVPLWMALVDGVLLRHRIGWLTTFGLVLGFGGAVLLIGTTAFEDSAPVSGMLVCVGATLSWTIGSLYSRNAPLPRRPLVGTGMEMMLGGGVLVVVGALRGELTLLRIEDFSAASLLALAYLITFGSWIGFTSYVWLLRNARTSLVSTYAYVNPVVAVFLGWLILGESISIRTLIAAAIIVVAVATIITAGSATREADIEVEWDSAREGAGAGVEAERTLERVGDPQEAALAEDGGRELNPHG